MKRKLFFKLFVFAVIAAFVTVTSCKDYDDDIKKLEGQISGVQTDLPSKIDAVKTELNTALNAKIKTVDDEVAKLKSQLADLEKKGATKAELDAVKKEIIEKTVALEAYNAFKAKTEADLNELSGKITALTSEAATKKELADAKKALQDAINELEAKAATKEELKKEVADAKKILEQAISNLEAKAATKEELADAKKALEKLINDLEAKAATKEALKAEVDKLTTALKDVKDALVKDLNDYKLVVEGKFANIQGQLDAMDVEVKALDKAHKELKKEVKDFLGDYKGNVQMIRDEITALDTKLSPRIDLLEAILKVKDGKSEVIADIYEKLGEQLAKIQANETEIAAVKADLQAKYDELKGVDEDLQEQISDNKEAIDKINTYIKDKLEPRLDKIEKAIEGLTERMEKAEGAIDLNISNILVLSRQLKGLTFIPTRGLPSEKTMKLYYYAGDYSANHVLMYRVNPSNAKLGRDFSVESLNYQITTRSASDGVNDGSENVSVAINGEVTQDGDIIYVPVHVQGPSACDVFGDKDWTDNEYFHGESQLWDWVYDSSYTRSSNGDYFTTNNKGLSLVLTAKTNSVEEVNGKKTVGEEVYVKSSEMVNTELIPTQIKLAESRKGQGNVINDDNLKERLLKRTLDDAAAWANENENTLPNDNKNWNVLAWSGNQGEGGVWTPGKIDLYKYVSSFYYPQDGGDRSRQEVVQNDPHRYLYAEFGKEFGKPYTDRPNYEKPVYIFEQMTYKDVNHNITIGPKDGEGVTHSYASIEGSMLTVFNTAESIQGVRNKKLIIKVTQINSECKDRQPVGYLVIKYTDSPENIWPDVEYTVDLTAFPYYHKKCNDEANGAKVIPQEYNDGDPGVTFTHKDALLKLFTADRFMSPINAPESYGLTGKANPGDVNVMLGGNLQLNGIGEHNMGNIYNIQRRDASVVDDDKRKPVFTAASYNHVNDVENGDATKVTAKEAFSHVMIRYEYGNHSYIVYVDDHAPAGDYEITYKLENKENNTQHGNVLYLTFKFKVALREITVEHDKNTVNWQDDNKTIRVQHTRIVNSIDGHSKFLSDEGYRVDLKQAFVLNDGTVDIATQTLPAIGGVEAGNAPGYRPKFEFVQDAEIKKAGFTYVRDDNNYLTEIHYANKLAARIDNDPADKFNYLYIPFSKEGDMLYNYLMQDMHANNDLANHNTWTKWGGTELTLKDDMERLLPVRMVTDINAGCANPEMYKFPNGNYYYIDDFNIKFERALRWAFTTVELTDNQFIQASAFNFATKEVDPEDETKSVYRGLFDHAYEKEHGYGNLVHPGWTIMTIFPYTFTNPAAQAEFYGLPRPEGAPMMFRDTETNHVLNVNYVFGLPGVSINGTYEGLDYTKVEVSTDKGVTWKPADKDYSVLTHGRRYFNVINLTFAGQEWPVAIWQGDQTAITSPIYFRVPVVNQTAIDNGLAPEVVDPEKDTKNYWMTFRKGYAKVKGYAVFKINPRK